MTAMPGARCARHRRLAQKSSLVGRILTVTVAAGAAVLLAAAASGGTYAFLRSGTTSGGGVVTAGTAALSVTTALTLATSKLYPGGPAVTGSAVVRNDGDVPLSLRVVSIDLTGGSTSFSGALAVSVSAVPGTGACPGTGTVFTAGVPASGTTDLGLRLAKASSATVCVSVSLSAAAPASSNDGLPVTFSVMLDGKQVA